MASNDGYHHIEQHAFLPRYGISMKFLQWNFSFQHNLYIISFVKCLLLFHTKRKEKRITSKEREMI